MVAQVVLGLLALPFTLSRVDQVLRDQQLRNPGLPVTAGGFKAGAVGGAVSGGALALFLAYKILMRRRWAWIVELVLASLGVLAGLRGAFGRYGTALTAISLLLTIAVLVLLLSRPVRDHVASTPSYTGGLADPGYPLGYGQQGYGQQVPQPPAAGRPSPDPFAPPS